VPGADLPGDWWTIFHDKDLDALVERALKANPDLRAAQAALRVARESAAAQRGGYVPAVSAGVQANRTRTSGDLSPVPTSGAQIYNLYTPQVSVSFVPDLFGLNRRTVESLEAQEQAARYALAATHITLTSNLAAAAIQEASLGAQAEATRQMIASNARLLEILRDQLAKGYASRLDVAAQEAQLAQAAATLPPLLKQLAQQRDLRVLLTGSFPGQDPDPRLDLADFTLPRDLPLSLSSRLVAQRPDVLLAEANLHAACAQVGIAVANRLPSLTLTADAGSSAVSGSNLFKAATAFWDVGAGLTQPIFQGGTLMHRERAARAAYEQAEAQYRSTVLTAFQNVADTLHALQQDAEGLKAASDAKSATTTALELTRRQFEAGRVAMSAVLAAELSNQQAVLAFLQAQAARYTDTVALYQALGGGWWNRQDIPE
jgi:NodT family efflux transporter outer membrane factor (OMF) lipoprotein